MKTLLLTSSIILFYLKKKMHTLALKAVYECIGTEALINYFGIFVSFMMKLLQPEDYESL